MASIFYLIGKIVFSVVLITILPSLIMTILAEVKEKSTVVQIIYILFGSNFILSIILSVIWFIAFIIFSIWGLL